MWRVLFNILIFVSLVKGQEAIGACKNISTLVNQNDTIKPPLIEFRGNITVFAMLNASSEACIQKAEMIKELDNQLWSTKYFQMNFVILNTMKKDQIGNRQLSERLQQAAGNVTVLSDAAHNVTGWLKTDRDYIFVINRCGRQIFQIMDPCNVSCSDLKTAIFTTFYDNVYRFCGDCQIPYAIPVDARVEQLNPNFYKNIDNCGNLSIPEHGSELFDSFDNVHWSQNNNAITQNHQNNHTTDKIEERGISSDNISKHNRILRIKNSEEEEQKNELPLKIRLELPNIHTINYRITKHSQIAPGNHTEDTIKNMVIEQEMNKNGKDRITVKKNTDDSVIETQYFDKKYHTKKNSVEDKPKENKWKTKDERTHESIEEILNDNLIEFSNGTSAENSFKLTNGHAMFHIYNKMLPKLRKLLEQQKTK